MLKALLTAQPMVVGDTDFDLNDPELNRKAAIRLIRDRRAKMLDSVLPGSGVLWAIQHAEGGFLFAIDNEGVIRYFVRYVRKYVLKVPAIRQIALWRDPSATLTVGLTRRAFNDILLPITGCMAADQEQTTAGRDFWLRRLSEAFLIGQYVYIADIPANQLLQLADDKDLRLHVPTVWGKGSEHLNRIPIIAASKLPERLTVV